jgi:uncharacterized protein involved in type VI secretion and phage assembly
MARSTPNGIVIGEVCDLEDPENIGRVRVTFPHLDNAKSDWMKIATPMGGKERGFFFRPEKGDEVLIAYEQNDSERGYILGALWSKTDSPPAQEGNAKDNNWRFIRSRSGHIIKLDDKQGSEKIEIIDKDSKRKIVIDCQGSKIQVIADAGDIEVNAGAGNVKVSAAQNVEINAKGDVTIKATNLTLEASGKVTIKGASVNIN